MSATLAIDLHDPTPPYEQLRRQLADLIASGQLPTGERLPPVRQLAADLGLANGTVARCYRELEAAGLVVSKRGAGTRVAPAYAGVDPSETLRREAESFVARLSRLGFGEAEAAVAVRRAWAAR